MMMRLCLLSSVGVVLAVSGCSLTPQAISGGAAPRPDKISRQSASGTLTTLYSFRGQPDGADPQGSLDAVSSCIRTCVTKIWGNTSSGGTNDAGTIYVLSRDDTSGSYSESVSLSYTPSTTGSSPTGPVALHTFNGPLFGTASQGGADGKGTVIELNGSNPTVFSFDGHNGASPVGLAHPRGIYYAITFAGGRHDRGAIVSIMVRHQKLVPKVVYSFSGKSDGEHPNSFTITGIGDYGTTAGSKGVSGTVYSFGPERGLTTLYTFKGPNDGVAPNGISPVVPFSKNLPLFGTTLKGGLSGDGTVYELKPNGSTYTKTTLHTFTGGSGDGSFPQGRLVFQSASRYGVFYGVTKSGGRGGCGTIFSVDVSSGNYTSLYSFTCGDDGAYPEAPLTVSQDFTGTLDGTTSAGGNANKGVVFSYKP